MHVCITSCFRLSECLFFQYREHHTALCHIPEICDLSLHVSNGRWTAHQAVFIQNRVIQTKRLKVHATVGTESHQHGLKHVQCIVDMGIKNIKCVPLINLCIYRG